MTDQECHVDQFGRSEGGHGSAVEVLPSCMQSADPIGESTDGQVGAQTSNRLSVPRPRTQLCFVKIRRSTIRPIPVSAVWKVPDDLAQTRVSLHAGKSTPLFSPPASKGTASMRMKAVTAGTVLLFFQQ